jgi:hypothetical protein
VTLKRARATPKGQHLQRVSAGSHLQATASNSRPRSFPTMAKTYKQMKEAWVSGHTGSSVADVNSVSLAMPVPYTHPRLAQCAHTDHDA